MNKPNEIYFDECPAEMLDYVYFLEAEIKRSKNSINNAIQTGFFDRVSDGQLLSGKEEEIVKLQVELSQATNFYTLEKRKWEAEIERLKKTISIIGHAYQPKFKQENEK